MSTPITRTRTKSEAITDFFLASKIRTTLFTALIMLFVGIIPAILISMAP